MSSVTHLSLSLTDECSHEEDSQWHSDDRRDNIDEPVGKKWCYSKENDVVQQITTVFLHLRRKSTLKMDICIKDF